MQVRAVLQCIHRAEATSCKGHETLLSARQGEKTHRKDRAERAACLAVRQCDLFLPLGLVSGCSLLHSSDEVQRFSASKRSSRGARTIVIAYEKLQSRTDSSPARTSLDFLDLYSLR